MQSLRNVINEQLTKIIELEKFKIMGQQNRNTIDYSANKSEVYSEEPSLIEAND